MKYLLAACAAAFALSASAFAEEAAAPAQELPPAAASQCTGTLPPEPTGLPDGATANARAMQQGNAAYQAWAEGFRPVYDCNRAEYQQALANLRARQATMEGLNSRISTLTTSWEAEVNEYNARTQRGR